jgi:hypothetical protein
MMRNHIDQNLRRGAYRLPLLLCLLDYRFGFSVQALRLFDDRSCSIEKIDQRFGRWQITSRNFRLKLKGGLRTEIAAGQLHADNEVAHSVEQVTTPCFRARCFRGPA